MIYENSTSEYDLMSRLLIWLVSERAQKNHPIVITSLLIIYLSKAESFQVSIVQILTQVQRATTTEPVDGMLQNALHICQDQLLINPRSLIKIFLKLAKLLKK